MSKKIKFETLLDLLKGPKGSKMHLLAFVAETEAFAGFCIGVNEEAYSAPMQKDLQVFFAHPDPDQDNPHYRLKYQDEYELDANGIDVKVTLVDEKWDEDTETEIVLVFARAVNLVEEGAAVDYDQLWCSSCGKHVPAEYSGVHVESGTRENFCAECIHVMVRDGEIRYVRRLVNPEEKKSQ